MYIEQINLANEFLIEEHIALMLHIVIIISVFHKQFMIIAIMPYIIHNILIQLAKLLDIIRVMVQDFFTILIDISLTVHRIFIILLQLSLNPNFLPQHKVMHRYIFKLKNYLIFNKYSNFQINLLNFYFHPVNLFIFY